MMKPKIIHGPRSAYASKAMVIQDAVSSDAVRQDGELFIGGDGAVYVHRQDRGNELLLAPKNMIVLDPAKSATTRGKRETLARLKVLIEMRDCARRILSARAQDPKRDDLWLNDQRRLERLYDVFVRGFGPIHKAEMRRTGRRNEQGEAVVSQYRPNLADFHRDPHAAVLAQVEHYDAASGVARLAPAFAQVARPAGRAKAVRVKAPRVRRLEESPRQRHRVQRAEGATLSL